MRLCFLVKTRKAIGLRVAGGNKTGSTDAFGGAGAFMGCTGVPKAGDEEGIGSVGEGAARKRGAVRRPAGFERCIVVTRDPLSK